VHARNDELRSANHRDDEIHEPHEETLSALRIVDRLKLGE
jgi:hypothetical protein